MRGIEPPSVAWKATVLTVELHSQRQLAFYFPLPVGFLVRVQKFLLVLRVILVVGLTVFAICCFFDLQLLHFLISLVNFLNVSDLA